MAEEVPQKPPDSDPEPVPMDGPTPVPGRGPEPVPPEEAAPMPAGGDEPVSPEGPAPMTPWADELVPPEVVTPKPAEGATPVPPKGPTPTPVRGATPLPKGPTPTPAGGARPVPPKGATPLPQKGTRLVPKAGATPLPQKGTRPIPKGGPKPIPTKGTKLTPRRGATPVPQKGTRLVPKGGAAPAPPKKTKPTTKVTPSKQAGKKTPSTSRASATVRKTRPKPPPSDEGLRLRQPGRHVRSEKGLSLRWKIVAAMAGITVATGILIFIVVYSRAVNQYSREIDDKGIRLIKTLAGVDSTYWRHAIYNSREWRQSRFDHMLQKLFGSNWGEGLKAQILGANANLRGKYEEIINPSSTRKKEKAYEFLGELRDQVIEKMGGAAASQEIQKDFAKYYKDSGWRNDFEVLVDPFGAKLEPLKADPSDIGVRASVVNITVQDISRGVQDAPGISAIQLGRGQSITYDKGSERIVEGVSVQDGRDTRTDQPIRLYILDLDHPGGGKLRFNVLLSLVHINEALGSLRFIIILATIVATLAGTGVAIWISALITEPIKILMSDINQVSAGDLDHETVPVSRDEVGMLAVTFNRMTEALRAAHEQELSAKAVEHELSIASEIQTNLVPKRMLRIPGFDVGAYYRPSKDVGGDYYDFIEIDEDHEGIIVADVSGKGIPGAMVMSMARAFIRMEATRFNNTSPGDTLIRANRMLVPDIKKGMFVTVLYCILNKKTNEFTVASAGHNPMVLFKADGNRIELVNPGGIALGFDKGPVFEKSMKEEKLVLDHGDRVVLYTDGIVEMMDAANEEFGDDRFYLLIQKLAARDSGQMINLVVKAVDEHRSAAPQHDDVTIVTLRYQ